MGFLATMKTAPFASSLIGAEDYTRVKVFELQYFLTNWTHDGWNFANQRSYSRKLTTGQDTKQRTTVHICFIDKIWQTMSALQFSNSQFTINIYVYCTSPVPISLCLILIYFTTSCRVDRFTSASRLIFLWLVFFIAFLFVSPQECSKNKPASNFPQFQLVVDFKSFKSLQNRWVPCPLGSERQMPGPRSEIKKRTRPA